MSTDDTENCYMIQYVSVKELFPVVLAIFPSFPCRFSAFSVRCAVRFSFGALLASALGTCCTVVEGWMISPLAAVIALCTSGTAAGTGGGIGGIIAVGPVDHHAAVAGLGFGHHTDDGVGIFFGDFEEGDGGEEVDAADFDLTLDVAIDDIDDFAGEEMVALATVDEKSAVTFLRLMWL